MRDNSTSDPSKILSNSDAVVSVVILCCNAVDFSRACLKSVFANTSIPYELVLVDNGSTDGTRELLESLRGNRGPRRVEIIYNSMNVGFPAGCNQAISKAIGTHFVFLNNDVLVPPGWAESLIVPTKAGQNVGLVGPVSNYAAGPQLVRPAQASREPWESIAARQRKEYSGRWFSARRLTSMCLLVDRAVFDRIGRWDERFGIGFYDDDDLCLRATRAGFTLAIAQEVYVHHFGSQTFKALGLDVERQLSRSAAMFRDKWQGRARQIANKAMKTSLPPPAAFHGQQRVSICMIVKNEEANLGDCLSSVASLANEIVVVDTGSTDRTRDVAAAHGALVHEFPWIDCFAAARNESLRHATGEWLFLLDADDRVDAENREKIRALFAGLGDENAAYVFKVRSRVDPAGRSVRLLDQVRVFRKHPDLKWQYRIHEQIVPSLNRLGGVMRWTDIVIDHTGYQDPATRRRKLERNLRLLQLEQEERPNDPFTLFNLGRTYQDIGSVAEGVALLRRSLKNSPGNLSIVRKLYSLLASGYQQLGEKLKATEICAEGLAKFPDDAELLFYHSILLRSRGDLAAAESSLSQLLESRPAEYFDMVDSGIRSFKARHQLALVRLSQNLVDDAEKEWRLALDERPDFVPSLVALGDLFVRQKRWAEVDEITKRLDAMGDDATDAIVQSALMRSRSRRAQGNVDGSLSILQSVCDRIPSSIEARVVLSQILLQKEDWQLAERTLREILEMSPDNRDARHNLALLERRMRKPPSQ